MTWWQLCIVILVSGMSLSMVARSARKPRSVILADAAMHQQQPGQSPIAVSSTIQTAAKGPAGRRPGMD